MIKVIALVRLKSIILFSTGYTKRWLAATAIEIVVGADNELPSVTIITPDLDQVIPNNEDAYDFSGLASDKRWFCYPG